MKDHSARSQFRALCYRQISARLGHAVAKASVMRLLGYLVSLFLNTLLDLFLLETALARQSLFFLPPFSMLPLWVLLLLL